MASVIFMSKLFLAPLKTFFKILLSTSPQNADEMTKPKIFILFPLKGNNSWKSWTFSHIQCCNWRANTACLLNLSLNSSKPVCLQLRKETALKKWLFFFRNIHHSAMWISFHSHVSGNFEGGEFNPQACGLLFFLMQSKDVKVGKAVTLNCT